MRGPPLDLCEMSTHVANAEAGRMGIATGGPMGMGAIYEATNVAPGRIQDIAAK